MADVLHLADRLGFHPCEITGLAQAHYDAEVRKER
jgi:hypothetical protein